MKSIVKLGLIFVGGFGAGIGCGYAIANRKLSKKYNDICEKEIADARKMYNDRVEEELVRINDAARKKVEEAVLKHDKPDISTIDAEYLKEAETSAETGEYIDESGIPEYDKKEAPKKSGKYNYSKRQNNGSASFITEDDFHMDREYDKNYFTMYADGVIADEMDEVVEPHRFGADGLDIRGRMGEAKEAYLRNKDLGQDFNIVLDYRDYYTAVGRHPN